MLPSRISAIDPSDGDVRDLVRRCPARCKAARAKRVDDERVRKCASHVGELVQSHPSSASAVLARTVSSRSPKLAEDAARFDMCCRATAGPSGGRKRRRGEGEKGQAAGTEDESSGVPFLVARLIRDDDGLPNPLSADGRAQHPASSSSSPHCRAVASRVRLHAHALGGVLKVSLTVVSTSNRSSRTWE